MLTIMSGPVVRHADVREAEPTMGFHSSRVPRDGNDPRPIPPYPV